MAKESGWWELTVDVEIDDIDREHIAKLIAAGFTGGEICAIEGGEDE